MKIGVLLFVLCAATSASAETIEKSGTFGGLLIHYKVVLPPNFDPARAYPTILAFPGGGQEMRTVDGSLARNYRAEAERRGYIVVMPAAPDDGHLFLADGARAFPAFLQQLLRDYKVQGGKVHVAGNSNGGTSAFHIASLNPKYVASLTGFPGLLEDERPTTLAALKPICIFMHVGDMDSGWLEDMETQARMFKEKGFKVHFTIEKNEGHGIRGLGGAGAARLFDQFELASKGCSQ